MPGHNPPSLAAARGALEVFGLADFRPGQWDAIEALLAGKDALVVLPTGGGKSLIYQLPAVLRGSGLTLVVSPLIALMKDQTDALRALGIPAGFCNSTQDELEQRSILSHAVTGKLRLLYVSPERALSTDFLSMLPRMNINAIAVDEAHCISQWGHDFRPEYRSLHNLRRRAGGVPVVALTATATDRVIKDVVSALDLRDYKLVKKSFYRPNLVYKVEYPANDAEKQALLLHLLEEGSFRLRRGGKCIVYCATRKKVDQLFEFLKAHGFNAGRYHAGRTSAGREKMHDSYAAGKVNILVATNAFGMGMDAPDVRMVLHYQVPASIDAYYQESGRAGRDGRDSQCVLFFNNSDFVTQSFIIGKEGGSAEGLLTYVREFGFSQTCRQRFLCSYFGEEIAACGRCDFCLGGEASAGRSFLEREQEKKQALEERSVYPFRAEEIEAIRTVLREFPGKFGKKILAGILRGSKARDIIRYRLSQSSVYGALNHVPEESIVRFFEDGIKAGQIKIAGTKYPRIYLAESPPMQRKQAQSKSTQSKPRSPESELLRELRSYRDREARRLKWKKYMVMQNAILARIAAMKPASHADLALVKGLGHAKVEKFGREILRIVQQAPGGASIS